MIAMPWNTMGLTQCSAGLAKSSLCKGKNAWVAMMAAPQKNGTRRCR